MFKAAVAPGWVLADEAQYESYGGRAGGVQEIPASSKQLSELYEREVWSYVVTRRKAEVVADIPWVLKREAKGAKDEIVADHPARDFLWKPGPNRTYQELVFATVAHLELSGRAFWEMAPGGEGGAPSQAVPLLPHLVKPKVKPREGVVGYTYRPNREPVEYDADEVVWFREFSATEEYGSVSPARAAWMSAVVDQDARQWNATFFRRSATPETMLTAEQRMSRDEMARIEQDFENRNKGVGKGRGTYFLPFGVTLHRAGLTQREMDFRNLRLSTMQEILAASGVPPVLVGLETENYATARIQLSIFMRRICIPLLNRVFAKIEHEVLPRFPDSEGLYLAVDETEIRIPDEQDDVHAKTIASFQAGIITRTEARAKLGYEIDVPGDERDPEADRLPGDEEREEEGTAEARSALGEDGEEEPLAKGAVPPEQAMKSAAKGIELAKGHGGRGSTANSLARAQAMAAGTPHGPRDLRRLANWHERHAEDREVAKDGNGHGTWGDEENPSADWIAFLLRGGEEGRNWAQDAIGGAGTRAASSPVEKSRLSRF